MILRHKNTRNLGNSDQSNYSNDCDNTNEKASSFILAGTPSIQQMQHSRVGAIDNKLHHISCWNK